MHSIPQENYASRNIPEPFEGLGRGIPQFLYLATLFYIPFYRWRHLAGIKWDWVLVAMLGVLVLPYIASQKSFPRAFRSNLWPWFGLFFGVNLVSSILSPYPAKAFDGLRILILDFLFISVNLIMINQKGFSKWVPAVLVASVSINAFLAILGYFFHVQAFLMGTRGIGGTIGANNAALMSNFIFPIITHWVFAARSAKARVMAAGLFLINLFGIIATESRGGFLVMILVFMLLAWTHRERFELRYAGLVAAGFGLLLIVSYFTVPEHYVERQKSITRGTQADVSTKRRAAYLRVVWHSFKKHPLIGSGTNTFSTIWVHSPVSLRFKRVERGAHNTYAEVLVGSGLIGLALFVGLLVRALRNYNQALSLLRLKGDPYWISLVANYRISFLSVLGYFFFKSGINHKMFLLGLSLSQLALTMAQEAWEGKTMSSQWSKQQAAQTISRIPAGLRVPVHGSHIHSTPTR